MTRGNGMRLASIALCAFLVGCATANHEERESLLAEPIDCAVAQEDIDALEAAMPSARERRLSAVQTIVPIGAVASVATGSYRDRVAVLTGRTTEELNARISDIRTTCGPAATSRADQQ